MSPIDRISQPFAGILLPWRCVKGMEERAVETAKTREMTTIRGRTRLLRLPWSTRMEFTLSGSGDRCMPPPGHLFSVGATGTFRSNAWHTRLVMPDEATVTVERVVVPGHAVCRTYAGAVVGITVTDDEVFVAPGRTEPVVLRYRLQYDYVVADPLVIDSSEATGLPSSYSMRLVEEVAR